mgnify:CR=1 FL=1
MKIKKIPIYKCHVAIIDNKEEWLKEFPNEPIGDYTIATTCTKGGDVYLYYNKVKMDASSLAHECLHLVNFIFLNKGIDANLNNDEHQAYLIGWLFETLEPIVLKKIS